MTPPQDTRNRDDAVPRLDPEEAQAVGDPDDPGLGTPVGPAGTESSEKGFAAPFDAAMFAAAVDESMRIGVGAVITPFGRADASPEPRRESKPAVEACLEEIAEDMLDLLQRVQGIESALAGLDTRQGRIEQAVREGLFLQAREVDALRRELVGDHKILLGLGALNGLAPALERFRLMRDTMTSAEQSGSVAHFDAAIEILAQTIQSLGFESFEPTVGEPFDPGRMYCAGHQPGPAGVVLAVDRPGYRSAQGVARPAGVLLAKPVNAAPELAGSDPTTTGAE
jgi:hypothetical protein